MIIAIVTPGVFELPSGTSSSVERIAVEIAERLSGPFRLYVLGKRERLPAYEPKGNVTYVRFRSSSAASYRRQCRSWLKRHRPSLIQVENRPRLAAWLKKIFPRIPVWLNLHSTNFALAPRLPRRARAACLRRTDRVLFNSAYLRSVIWRRVPKSARRPSSVLHPGTDIERFASRWEPEGERLREQWKEREGLSGKSIVLFAGRLVEQKGAHLLLRAWKDVIAACPDAVLIVAGSARVGRAKATDYVKKLHAAGNAMPNHVRFLSFVPYEDMPRWFVAADLAVVPSVRREAFGLVNVEAMAAGTPVIAADAGGIGEAIEDGVTGRLLRLPLTPGALAEAIVGLLNDPEARRAFGTAGRERVMERFTWEQAALRYQDMYERHLLHHSAAERGDRRHAEA